MDYLLETRLWRACLGCDIFSPSADAVPRPSMRAPPSTFHRAGRRCGRPGSPPRLRAHLTGASPMSEAEQTDIPITVLIVDDEELLVKSCGQILSSEGYTVHTEGRGKNALE